MCLHACVPIERNLTDSRCPALLLVFRVSQEPKAGWSSNPQDLPISASSILKSLVCTRPCQEVVFEVRSPGAGTPSAPIFIVSSYHALLLFREGN